MGGVLVMREGWLDILFTAGFGVQASWSRYLLRARLFIRGESRRGLRYRDGVSTLGRLIELCSATIRWGAVLLLLSMVGIKGNWSHFTLLRRTLGLISSCWMRMRRW